MSETPPRKQSKRRRPPPKPAWHEHPWLLPGLGIACLVMVLGVGVAWWTQREVDPVAQAGGGDLQETLQEVYQGDYTLLDPNVLEKKQMLPEGLQMRKDANELTSSWGRAELMGANSEGRTQPPYTHYLVIYYTVPQKDCATLAGQLLTRYGQVWVGSSAPLPNPQERVNSQGDIAAKCQGASSSIMALGQ